MPLTSCQNLITVGSICIVLQDGSFRLFNLKGHDKNFTGFILVIWKKRGLCTTYNVYVAHGP